MSWPAVQTAGPSAAEVVVGVLVENGWGLAEGGNDAGMFLGWGIGHVCGSNATGDRVVGNNDGPEEVGDSTDDGAADGALQRCAPACPPQH
jgi:hypothetical protein